MAVVAAGEIYETACCTRGDREQAFSATTTRVRNRSSLIRRITANIAQAPADFPICDIQITRPRSDNGCCACEKNASRYEINFLPCSANLLIKVQGRF